MPGGQGGKDRSDPFSNPSCSSQSSIKCSLSGPCVSTHIVRGCMLSASPAEQAESGGPSDPYSDASAKYGPLKLPELQAVDLSKMYGGAAQVS